MCRNSSHHSLDLNLEQRSKCLIVCTTKYRWPIKMHTCLDHFETCTHAITFYCWIHWPRFLNCCFLDYSDFDISYVLTFIRTDPHVIKTATKTATKNGTKKQRRLFSSMACVFVVAAAGPAMPDVRAEPYNGAVCMWSRVDGVGEDYFLDFNE